MHKDMYDTFDNKCIPYNYPFSFQGKSKLDYMEGINTPTYEMDYGDTAVFPFCISEKYQDSNVLITIYNFRHEEVYEELQSVDEETGKIYLEINEDLSAKLYKGNYFIRLQARDRRFYANEEEEEEQKPYYCTILAANDCILHVE